MPLSHGVHSVLGGCSGETAPIHRSQAVPPVLGCTLPGGQSVQAVISGVLKVPDGHSSQSSLSALVTFPGSHVKHDPEVAVGVYWVFGWQARHAFSVVTAKPLPHGTQAVRSSLDVYPSGHGWHAVSPETAGSSLLVHGFVIM